MATMNVGGVSLCLHLDTMTILAILEANSKALVEACMKHALKSSSFLHTKNVIPLSAR
jgi:hypothetical protein